jgi:predicted Zn finger-like uncharacterized protein
MNVTCPACAARYTCNEQKLRGKTARMRCRACDTVWLVSGPPADAAPAIAEPEAAPESETAARVVRRGAEREKRDLFASRPYDGDGAALFGQTLRPPPPAEDVAPPAPAGTVASRNENSVLFTLAGLSGAARLKTPEPQRTPMSQPANVEQDDGIIDLKALSSLPPRPGALPVMPLFSEPPPAAFARDAGGASSGYPVAAHKPAPAKLIATVAAAIAAVVIAGVGLAYVFRGEKPVPVAAAMAVPPPPPAIVAPPAPAPEPTAVATAESKSTSTDDDTASSTTAKGGKHHKGGKAGKHTKWKAHSAAPSAPKASHVKAADPCGCKGDFNCVIACTVKKGK